MFDPRFVAQAAMVFEADRRECDTIDEAWLNRRNIVAQTIDQLAADALNVVDLIGGSNR